MTQRGGVCLHIKVPSNPNRIRKNEKFTKGYEELEHSWGSVVCLCFDCLCVWEEDGECVRACVCVWMSEGEREGRERGEEWRGSYSHKLTAAGWGAVSSHLSLKLKSIGVKSNEGSWTLSHSNKHTLAHTYTHRHTHTRTHTHSIHSNSPSSFLCYCTVPHVPPLTVHHTHSSTNISQASQLVNHNRPVSSLLVSREKERGR